MPELVRRLAARLDDEGIAYCCWKGGAAVERALAGERDLDVLVARDAFARAEAALAATGLKAARSRFVPDLPGTAHFFGHEPGRERLLHVHLHDRVLTGEDLIQSHALPFEEPLLGSPAYAHGLRVPAPPLEVVLTVLKHAVRWGSLPDAALARLRPKDERAALARLLEDATLAEASALLRARVPALDERTFRACAESLRGADAGPERRRLAARVRRALRPYARTGALGRLAAYVRVTEARARRLLDGDRRDKALRGPGVVIAFAGGSPAARAACVAETRRWLGQAFAVRTLRAPAAARPAPGEIVLVDGEPAGGADLRIDVAASPDVESVRARVWDAL